MAASRVRDHGLLCAIGDAAGEAGGRVGMREMSEDAGGRPSEGICTCLSTDAAFSVGCGSLRSPQFEEAGVTRLAA